MFVISQVAGFLQILVIIWAFQVKDKKKTLLLYALANILAIITNAFLLNFIIVAVKCVSLFKNSTFAWLQNNREKLTKVVDVCILFLFWVLAFGAVWISRWLTGERHWFDWMIFGVLLFTYWSEWSRGIHRIRISSLVYYVVIIINAMMFFNVAMIIEAIIISGSIFVFYYRYLKRPQDNRPTDSGDSVSGCDL